MIAIERLKKVRKIVTHADCPDGLASALILHDALPDAEVVFLAHGSKEHRELPIEEGVLFCDFTPLANFQIHTEGEETLAKWRAADVIVLDHHVTQKGIVESLGGIYAEDRSGAMLAFDEVWQQLNNPESIWGKHTKSFAARASMRDLWQTKDPFWMDACAQAASLMFWGWRGSQRLEWAEPEFLDVGIRCLEQRAEEVREAIKNSYKDCLPTTQQMLDSGMTNQKQGVRARIFPGKHLTSDAAESLGDSVDLVVGFDFIVEDNRPQIVFSTRSHTGFDCSALAKKNGGGGHKAAAGFKTMAGDPYEMFRQAFVG